MDILVANVELILISGLDPHHWWDVDVVSDTDDHMYLTPTILAI